MLVVRLQRRGDVAELRVQRLVAEREESLLRAIERERDVGGLVVRVGGDRRRRTEETSQDRAVAHGVRVALDLDGRGDGLDERPEIGDPAGSVELLTQSSARRRSATLKIASRSMSRLPRTCCSERSSNGTCRSAPRTSSVIYAVSNGRSR
ncbi:MAG: hypothetical protein E6H94_12265 [Chloroflexi bacterium]|nr:MAG: hypothetical protein E6H94_12265 [Chloroflexota bacterium]